MYIRQAAEQDVSRIAEILVYNNRINFFPIFRDEQYSFGEMQVLRIARQLLNDPERLARIWVYDDGILRGFVQIQDREIQKLYVDPFFQGRGIGAALMEFAIGLKQANRVWVLEKNHSALRFYTRHGFHPTGTRVFEEGTTEYLVELEQ